MNTTKNITEREIGFNEGVKYMEQKILTACERKKPIEINGRVYFIQNDIQHLRETIDKINTEGV